ncbi:MAG: hypothetical protein R2788_04430 [Saprospiraceae bacterium]
MPSSMADAKKVKDSTHGVLLEQWTCGNELPSIEFLIWDFGGQEIYQGRHRLFMASEAVQVILIDPEEKEKAAEKTSLPPTVSPGKMSGIAVVVLDRHRPAPRSRQ